VAYRPFLPDAQAKGSPKGLPQERNPARYCGLLAIPTGSVSEEIAKGIATGTASTLRRITRIADWPYQPEA
jgi:hypothetical protein